MSCSKPLPPFTFEVLCYLNRYQLERFSIVCRLLKNLIDRYFYSKPYRVFNYMNMRRGSYALHNKCVQWHPNRDDYSVQQFLDGQKCSIDEPWKSFKYYSFDKMRPYFVPTVRMRGIVVFVAGESRLIPITYKHHIEQMESISYLWHDGKIDIQYAHGYERIGDEDFQPILISSTILQCQILEMADAHFSFKDYKVLYSVKVIHVDYDNAEADPIAWLEFLEQPGVKPLVVLRDVCREGIDDVIDCISKAYSSAISPNAFKVVFAETYDSLTEFRKTNKTSGEILELKKGVPVEYYTLERSSI